MYFRELSETFAKIEATSKRLEKTAYLAEILKKLKPSEIAPVMYMTMGRVAPLYENIEFGLAEKQLLRTVAWASGRTVDVVTKEYKRVGDLGELIQDSRAEEEGSKRTIQEVFQVLRQVAEDKRTGSQERKIERLGRLLARLPPESAKYTLRLVAGKARLGFSDLTILDALSTAMVGDKSERALLEGAYNVSSDLGYVAAAYLQHGASGLANMDVTPGVPVRPMRAERLGTVPEIVEKLVRFAVEPKFDGMRVQIHAYLSTIHDSRFKIQEGLFGVGEQDDVEVKVFSRGLEDITLMFPDVVNAARALHKIAGDFVLDGEALGMDLKTGKYLPFQETMTRKRKYGVGEKTAEIPLRVQIFDVLYANGKGTLGKTYEERRVILDSRLKIKDSSVFVVAESTTVSDAKAAQKLFDGYMKAGLEGMLCKRLDSLYQAGARNYNWVKYKRAHEEGLVDTVDAVVMGYYTGKGKRQQFGIGAFLVGVRGLHDRIVTVAKIGTGLTDDQFRELYARMQHLESTAQNEQYVVPKPLVPDVFVEPKVVVEIQADEITESPVHTAGYALRFPRLSRFRDDKGVGEITTSAEVERLHALQAV